MRIISGSKRGTKLNTLEGDNTRPTLDRVKESLFNILYSKGKDYTIVLDLFAGSGGLGLETLSRGSGFVYFCDSSKDAINIINTNIQKCNFDLNSKVMNSDYIYCLNNFKKENVKFDLIFIDPPYNKGIGEEAIDLINKLELLNKEGIIVYEADYLEDIPNTIGCFQKIDERKYGKIKLYFYM